jgi:hypothetical protein
VSDLEVAGVVTLKDVWQAQTAQTAQLADAINAVERALERLAGHLDAIDQRNAGTDRTLLDYEGRLRALERWRYALPASVLLGLGSTAAAVVAVIHQ